MNVHRVADLWAGLMEELGYGRFAAQGGDIGAGVTTALGMRHPDRMIGLHLNFVPPSYLPASADESQLSTAEEEYLRSIDDWFAESGAYAHVQRTRPQTAAAALNDSPAGLAAWILEKFREWSHCDGDLFGPFDRDALLSNVTLYWMTETISSSFRMYFENRRAPLRFQPGDFVRPPCAIAHFPKEILFPPRSWVERGFSVQRWTEMPRGGHFAAMEEPQPLAQDIRSFFRAFR
jgi:pimeloyl-ACP methyl ester carboxylesterase